MQYLQNIVGNEINTCKVMAEMLKLYSAYFRGGN
jgi:hypothetical protein